MSPTFRAASEVGSTVASFTCAKPAGVVAGDVLVAFQASDTGTSGDMGTPAGGSTWLLLTFRLRDDTSTAGTRVWWKVAGASEPSSYGFTQEATADGAVSIVAVQGAGTGTPVVQQSGAASASPSVSTPSTTPVGSDDFEIRCVAIHSPNFARTWTPPSGFTERTDVQQTIFASTSTATRTLSSGAATGTHNFTASGSFAGDYHGFTVNISATTAVPPVPAFTGWGMPI